MAAVVASSADSGADRKFQRIQEVVNLDDDGILALQIALDLSATEIRGLL